MILVRPEEIDRAWPLAEPLIREVAEQSDHTPESIRDLIASNRWQLFMALGESCEAICLSEIIQYPKKRVLVLYVCHGKDHPRWLKHIETIEAWARGQGCQEMVPHCRDGWAKVLKGLGYSTTHRILKKSLVLPESHTVI